MVYYSDLKISPNISLLLHYFSSFLIMHLKINFSLTEVNDLPVMVWFHGGGFTSGQASMYGPEHLLDKDVILVTVNYRLGPLGFFTLGNEEVPGNQGMWDQYEGLQWVQNNIKSFGGNPNRVTIFGESAGGWSVTNHLASRYMIN